MEVVAVALLLKGVKGEGRTGNELLQENKKKEKIIILVRKREEEQR